MDGLREFNWTIRHIEKSTTPTDQSERYEKIAQFQKLFKTNQTFEDTEIKIQLKLGHTPKKQNARLKPYHSQNYVEKEINKVIKSGHLERVQKVDEDCFVSSIVITMKNDKSVKISLGSRKVNDSCTKMRPPFPNMEEILNQTSTEITQAPNDPLWISKIDLE